MNKLLLCAYHLRKLKPAHGVLEIHIVTDYLPADCRRLLSPWSKWLQILSCQERLPADIRPDQVVVAIGADTGTTSQYCGIGDETKALQQRCEQLGAACLVPCFGQPGTLDSDLIREVSFFDFELGGKNEWDGTPTRYSHDILTLLSSVHCRTIFPAWAFDGFECKHRPLKVMDIGCGPISRLRWGAIQGDLSITGVDPILDMYVVSLARHGLDALDKIRCDREIAGFAEDLDSIVPDNDFEVVYTCNALDHTQDPCKVVECIGRRLAPHGIAAITIAEREGTRQQWDQLHKTDIYLENGVLMYAHQNTPGKPLLTRTSGLVLKKSSMSSNWLSCTLAKLGN